MNKTIKEEKNLLISVIKGALLSISITLILILLFALIIKFFDISDKLIFPINQVIKVVSLFVGMMVITRGNKERGLIKGVLLALVYFVINFIVFSILQGSFSISVQNLYDMLLTILMGGIIGIISVYIGK